MTAILFIKITDKHEYSLETTNYGKEEFAFSKALHAYFNVGSFDEIEILGLNGYQYQGSLDGKIYQQSGNLKLTGEFNAAFGSIADALKLPTMPKADYIHSEKRLRNNSDVKSLQGTGQNEHRTV